MIFEIVRMKSVYTHQNIAPNHIDILATNCVVLIQKSNQIISMHLFILFCLLLQSAADFVYSLNKKKNIMENQLKKNTQHQQRNKTSKKLN